MVHILTGPGPFSLTMSKILPSCPDTHSETGWSFKFAAFSFSHNREPDGKFLSEGRAWPIWQLSVPMQVVGRIDSVALASVE